MPHQESPEIRQLRFRVTETFYRAIEKAAESHKMNISQYARWVIGESIINIKLTKEDYEIIRKRIENNAARISGKRNK